MAVAMNVWVWPARADITVAVIGPMSGQHQAMGTQLAKGAEMAVEVINSAGGLLGQKVRVVVKDDQCDPKIAAGVAEELGKLKVALADGHLCSGASIAASDIYRRHGIIQITPASTATEFTDRGLPNVFRTCGRDDMQGFVVAEHILRTFRTRKVGILHDDTAFSRGLAKQTQRFLNRGGMQEAFMLEFPEKQRDFSGALDRIRREKVQVLFFPSYAEQAAAILKQAKQKAVQFRLVAGDPLMNEAFGNAAGPLAEGVQITFPPDPSDDRRNKALTAKYMERGYKPTAFTFYSYAAVQIWAQAVTRAGGTEMNKVAAALRQERFDSVLGKVGFDTKGDISAPGFVVYTFDQGRFEYLR